MKKYIKLFYQVPHTQYFLGNTSKTTYEVRTCYQKVNEYLSDNDNLDKAFELACDLGCDPNKKIKWTVVTEKEYMEETFEAVKKEIPTLCRRWGKKNGSQFLYGDVLDWIRDQYLDIYHSPFCDTFARLIIGEFVIKTTAL